MNHLIKILILFLATTCSFPASAMTVVSDPSCGKWIEGRKLGVSDGMEWYVDGLLNGISLGSSMEFWNADANHPIDGQSAFLWLDQYCVKNPLSDISTGAIDLFKSKATRLKK